MKNLEIITFRHIFYGQYLWSSKHTDPYFFLFFFIAYLYIYVYCQFQFVKEHAVVKKRSEHPWESNRLTASNGHCKKPNNGNGFYLLWDKIIYSGLNFFYKIPEILLVKKMRRLSTFIIFPLLMFFIVYRSNVNAYEWWSPGIAPLKYLLILYYCYSIVYKIK